MGLISVIRRAPKLGWLLNPAVRDLWAWDGHVLGHPPDLQAEAVGDHADHVGVGVAHHTHPPRLETHPGQGAAAPPAVSTVNVGVATIASPPVRMDAGIVPVIVSWAVML